jgi:hypothetical protein
MSRYFPGSSISYLNTGGGEGGGGGTVNIDENTELRVNPLDTYIDPVSKIRVSQPANLTDTDFEYGLQESKWETLERVNNIPTFFSRPGDEEIPVVSVTATQNSLKITVQSVSEHNLIVGSPIIVQGLTANSAEGAYVVTAIIDDFTFEYFAKRTQSFPGLNDGGTFLINQDETIIYPGKLYQGTQYKLDNLSTIQTDGKDPSQLTVTTKTPHGFIPDTKFILSNTVGGKTFKFDATQINPDSLVSTESSNVLNQRDPEIIESYERFTSTNSDWQGRFGVFVRSTNVNLRSGTIFAPSHGFNHGDAIMYIAPRFTASATYGNVDCNIGGIASYSIYWAIVVSENEFQLTTSRLSKNNTQINPILFTDQGNTEFEPHHFMRVYEINGANTGSNFVTTTEPVPDLQNGQPLHIFSTSTGVISSPASRSFNNSIQNQYQTFFAQEFTTGFNSAGYGVISVESSNVNISTETMVSNQLLSSQNLETGDEVRYYQGRGLIGGLSSGTRYFIRVVSTTSFQLYTSRVNAINGTTTGRINLTSQGVGTHNFEKDRRYWRLATNESLTSILNITSTTITGTTWMVPSISLQAVSRDSLLIPQHGLETGDVVLLDIETDPDTIETERHNVTASHNNTNKTAFEGRTQINSSTNIFTTSNTTYNIDRTRTGTFVKYEVKPDYAMFQSNSVNTSTNVITTLGDSKDNWLRSFITGETVILESRCTPLNFDADNIPDLANDRIGVSTTQIYRNGQEVVFSMQGKFAVAPAGLVPGTTYFVRTQTTNQMSLHTTQAGAIANTGRVSITSQGFGVGVLTPVNALPTGIEEGNTYFIRVLGNTTFSLHGSSANAISNVSPINITTVGSGFGRVRQIDPTSLAGLTSGSTYYMRRISNTQLTLHPTRADAFGNTNIVNITSGAALGSGNGLHQFAVVEHGQSLNSVNTATTSRLNVEDSFQYQNGQQVQYVQRPTGSTSQINGLIFGAKYFVRVINSTVISLHKTASGALSDTSRVPISGAGNGYLVATSAPAGLGDDVNFIIEKIDSNRVRLRERIGSLVFQTLDHVPYQRSRVILTKRSTVSNSDTIFITSHGLSEKTELQYNSGLSPEIEIFSEFINGFTTTTLSNNTNFYVLSPSENRFRISRDPIIVNKTLTAGPSTIDTTAWLFTINNHGFRTGDTVIYDTVNPATGLQAGSMYYVLRMSDRIIGFANNTAWNTSTNILTVTHGYGANGTVVPVVYRGSTIQGGTVSSTTPAGGLSYEIVFYVRVLTSTTLAFYLTEADALQDTARINITSQGSSGTAYLEQSNRFALFFANSDLFDGTSLTIDPTTVANTPPSDRRVPILSFTNNTTHTFRKARIVDFVVQGSGEQELSNVSPNAVDGIYDIEEVLGGDSSIEFKLSPTNAVLSPRTLTFNPYKEVNLQYSQIRYVGHSLYDGAPVIYNPPVEFNFEQKDPEQGFDGPVIDIVDNLFINFDFSATTGLEVLYVSEDPLGGLESEQSYYLGNVSASSFALYQTQQDAIDDTNRIDIDSNNFDEEENPLPITGNASFFIPSELDSVGGLVNGQTYFVIRDSVNYIRLADSFENAIIKNNINLTDQGEDSNHAIRTFNIAAEVSGLGTVSTNSGSNVVNGSGTNFFNLFKIGDIFKIAVPRTDLVSTITQSGTTMNAGLVTTPSAHGFVTGDAVVYESTNPPSPLVSEIIYYVRVDSSTTFRLHPTFIDAIDDTNSLTFTGVSGTATFTTRYPGTVFESAISGIKSKTSLILEKEIPAINEDIALTPIGNKSSLNYLIGTSLFVKGDAFALHRPFDGGVELTPSLNPDSQVTRQTRKYFRYQSGKGIQVSFGINFNAPTEIDSYTRDIATGIATVQTRFPNRITEGLLINIVNAKDKLIPPDLVFEQTSLIVNTAENSFLFVQGHQLKDGMAVNYFSSNPIGGLTQGEKYFIGLDADNPTGKFKLYTNITGALTKNQDSVIEIFNIPSGNTVGTFRIENPWNGEYEVLSIVDERTFTIQLSSIPPSPYAQGFSQYTPKSWTNSFLRAGMFDDQNGMYFEFDGNDLYVCRRSSTTQISGTVQATFNSGELIGSNTLFESQLAKGDKIVVRGQTYKVVNISNDNILHIQPPYSGVSKANIIVSKVIDTRFKQSDWNLDPADGSGKSKFNLDLTKMQMAYMDYSWYGAGKVRFGFKGVDGFVRYFHEIVHNNIETEAYLRSGNLPTRYEVENVGAPSYSPTIAHWGTSVIMDGKFDDDKAYVFNAPANTLSFTNTSEQLTFLGQIQTTSGVSIRNQQTGLSQLVYQIRANSFNAVRNIRAGTAISGPQIQAGTVTVNQPVQSGATGIVYIDKQPTGTTGTGQTFNYGPGSDPIPSTFPLVSVRLAPAVDNGFTGRLGTRDIINRMQLILNEVGVITTHDINVKLLLNPLLDNINYSPVQKPSLSQLIKHSKGDTINGGVEIYNFRASGNSNATASIAQIVTKELEDVFELGNSILGGDGTYPDGPDVVTIAIEVIDTAFITADTPFRISGNIAWSESQA